MKFGVRQIANVVFRAKNPMTIGSVAFAKGQPVLYIDTAKTSSMESSATTVYATGGRGNTRLVTWEGEKTLTFTVEDALLSPVSFAMLSGAGVIKGASNSTNKIHFHQTSRVSIENGTASGGATPQTIDLTSALLSTDTICSTAPLYVMKLDEYGDLTGEIETGWAVGTTNVTNGPKAGQYLTKSSTDSTPSSGAVMVDYYVLKTDSTVTELQIDAGSFGGTFYVEADTLFRRQGDNKDLPANLTFPNVKIQSNFTFSMAASGDPSTFSFTMDAMPGYTYFNATKQVLCAIQVAEDRTNAAEAAGTVFPHPAKTKDSRIIESYNDSVDGSDSSGETDNES